MKGDIDTHTTELPGLETDAEILNAIQRRVCSAASTQLKWPPHQQMTLRQDKNCLRSGSRHKVGDLQSLKSNSPKLHYKASMLRKDCKATQALALHLGCYKFCFCPLSFFSHRLDTSRCFFTPDSHFTSISSRMLIITF